MADITINGEGVFRLTRDSRGLCFKIRFPPALEAFAKSLGDGTTTQLDLLGKEWLSDPRDQPLEVYDMGNPTVRGTYFTLSHPGAKMEVAPGVANLSFLRIKGASEREITFWVKEPRNKKSLYALRDTIGLGLGEIVEDFMRYLDLEIQFTFKRQGS